MTVTVTRSACRRIAAFLTGPTLSIILCYAAGLLATRLIAGGAPGLHLASFAAPLAMGVMIRQGRTLGPVDALKLVAVHVAVAIGFSDPAGVAAIDLARNLALVAAGSFIFVRLRASGFISSQMKVAAAVALAAAGAALAAGPIEWWALGGASASMSALAAHWAASVFCSALVIGVVLTHDRADEAWADADCGDREPAAAVWEHVAATALVGALVLVSVADGRPEAALAASVALLWFALRLGLFATSLAAFAFAAGLLAFASDGRWPAFLTASDPLETELLRYLALALLAAPSVVVAAAMHDQKRLRRLFAYRAMHDGLTRLANRSRFIEAIESATAASHSQGRRFALFLIDLDHFKAVNDGFGHVRGDGLLVEVSNRLRASVRSTDLVARIGGDEFAVVAPVKTADDAMKLARRLVETVNRPCDLDGASFMPSITLGGVLSPDSPGDAQRLILLADEALYAAKAAGRNCWRFSSSNAATGTTPILLVDDERLVPEIIYLD